MRKAQKKQAEDFIVLLGQAHDEIKKVVEKRNIQAALQLLADCQDGALSLGGLIERTEGEGAEVILLLEEYCEVLYQFYTQLSEEESVNIHKEYKKLNQSLTRIRNSIKNEIKVRQEVVFLPYKASMWDSLESVWRAAKEDPDCDAYVIPIPYYDRNPDGSFAALHDEADLYPKDVPVIHYQSYDFENRKPDLIFIHNPYDDCNYVTSVPPFFYSENLKRFTEKLVYIPYFILGEPNPENQEEIEGIKPFCLNPGVFHADQIIVQSEAMRQIYIKALTEYAGADTEKYWEEKILGLGSPKVDKVLSIKKEQIEVPEEWLQVFQKSDGSWKKVIFYNTGISAMLQHNEKMIGKIQNVLQIFKEHQNEVALLWRPHPLLKTTLESMRPKLLEAYRGIVEKYQAEGWGIYDDTADMDRAVVLADGYYGDWSSVVHLCQNAGVPVMIQDVTVE
ncbi:MAG: hypothetical protein HFI63_11995 [Lachnospiraceae bacterium]|nr:hypothetical protein [Lachnospiraceae bacterium]